MAKDKEDKGKKKLKKEPISIKAREVGAIISLAIFLIVLFSWFGFGAVLGDQLITALRIAVGGIGIFLIIFYLILLSIYLFSKKEFNANVPLGGFFAIVAALALLSILIGDGSGFIGSTIGTIVRSLFGPVVGSILLIGLVLIIFILTFGISLTLILEKFKIILLESQKARLKINQTSPPRDLKDVFKFKKTEVSYEDQKEEEIEKEKEVDEEIIKNEEEVRPPLLREKGIWISPPVDLFEKTTEKATSGDIKANAETIKKTLETFSVEVEMGEVNVGPTVTQYTLKPSEGVKLNQITARLNDLALALAAHPLRIEAPIPGKSAVGIEVPNQKVATVRLRDILESIEYRSQSSPLVFSLGRDVAGEVRIADLIRMPHLLIAGATGTGKSVAINSLLMSLLYRNSPTDLKLILVDPKRVELSLFNDIPHLLTPVIHDAASTISALRWATIEMERRFTVLSEAKKRNIQMYNQTAKEKLPYIVFIIDELADLMAVAARDVEAAIVRLAQMARATGIHLVVATQRPSVDVITGLIKANITARVAFTVASNADSRTILDSSGAERLLGRGDMLFTSAETGKPVRIQGALVSEKEVKSITDFVKKQALPEYDEAVIMKTKELGEGFSGEAGEDELFDQAKQIVVQAQKASASLLQRRLRIGYARAARLLDILESQDIIGPGDGAKAREVLIQPDNNMAYGVSEEESEEEFIDDEL